MFKMYLGNTGIKIIQLVLAILVILTAVNVAIILRAENDLLTHPDISMTHAKSIFESLIQYFSIGLFLTLAAAAIILFFTCRLYEEVLNTRTKVQSILDEKEKALQSQQKELSQQVELVGNLTNICNKTIEYDNLKTEFFSNMTHEIKTPVSVILGAIQLIEQNPVYIEKDKLLKHFTIIKQNCFRLTRLVNNLLDATRLDSGYISTYMLNCNIVYLVDDIIQSVAPCAEYKNLSIIFDTSAEEIIMAVDMDKIERVILNLLSNAIKFTPAGGKIFVKMYRTETNAYISVKDTGPGIPAEVKSIIFERFRQINGPLTREAEGSGIGLSLVKSFVELHNGSIKVVSEENLGSEFIVELPISLCNSGIKDDESITADRQNKIGQTIKIELSDIYNTAS